MSGTGTMAIKTDGPAIAAITMSATGSMAIDAEIVGDGEENVIFVSTAANLQTAINNSQPGDVLELEAGGTWTAPGTFVIPSGKSFLTLRSANYGSLVGRVVPADAANMARLNSPATTDNPLMVIEPETSNIKFIGIEFNSNRTSTSGNTYGLVRVGAEASGNNLGNLPLHDPADEILFDQCYFHGVGMGNVSDGIVAYNVTNLDILNSRFEKMQSAATESHAIWIYVAPGPTLIHNNYIEAVAINLFIGDSVMPTGGAPPQNVTITQNHISKPLEWHVNHPDYDPATSWATPGRHYIKNHLEIKFGSNVLIEGNLFENNWIGNQTGDSLVMLAVDEDITDVDVQYNVFKNIQHGMNIATSGYGFRLQRINVVHNLMYTETNIFDGSGWYSIKINGVAVANDMEIVVSHNTSIREDTSGFSGFCYLGQVFDGIDTFTWKDNIATRGQYGITGVGSSPGRSTVSNVCIAFSCANNVWDGTVSSPQNLGYGWYDDGTNFVDCDQWTSPRSVFQFTNTAFTAISHFKLQTGSPFHDAATDIGDVGADIDTIISKMAPGDVTSF